MWATVMRKPAMCGVGRAGQHHGPHNEGVKPKWDAPLCWRRRGGDIVLKRVHCFVGCNDHVLRAGALAAMKVHARVSPHGTSPHRTNPHGTSPHGSSPQGSSPQATGAQEHQADALRLRRIGHAKTRHANLIRRRVSTVASTLHTWQWQWTPSPTEVGLRGCQTVL